MLVDCANGAASATAPDLFDGLPLHADFIHREPDGVNINDGCGSTHLKSLSEGVVAGGYDLGIAFDGDADRCLLVDETGHTIDGDKVMAVCGADLRRHGKLSGNAIVATVMSNLGLHEYCRKEGIELVCTTVGDRHVLEKMLECGYAIGGEQSGHTILPGIRTTGDGELTALQSCRPCGAPESRPPNWHPAAPSIHRSLSMWPYPTFPASRMRSCRIPPSGTLSLRWSRSWPERDVF